MTDRPVTLLLKYAPRELPSYVRANIILIDVRCFEDVVIDEVDKGYVLFL